MTLMSWFEQDNWRILDEPGHHQDGQLLSSLHSCAQVRTFRQEGDIRGILQVLKGWQNIHPRIEANLSQSGCYLSRRNGYPKRKRIRYGDQWRWRDEIISPRNIKRKSEEINKSISSIDPVEHDDAPIDMEVRKKRPKWEWHIFP